MAQQTAQQRLELMDMGCNLSNWLEAYWVTEDQYPANDQYFSEDISAMKLAGMNNIRLNVNFERFLEETYPYQINQEHEAFEWIDSVLHWTEEEDMLVVICNHHGWDDLNDFTYDDIAPRVVALWDQLALKYKDTDPDRILFEVMNEPPILLSRSKTRLLMQQVVLAIRQHSVDHTIVVSGSLGSHASEFPNTIPLPDTNLIYTFHYYEPFYFTHQGASWTPIYFPIGATFPNAILNDVNVMRNHFSRIENWKQVNNVPVYMGEFGTINHGDEASKCSWITIMGELIDQYDMNWSYWDCKYSTGSRFGYFDGDEISPFNVRQCYRQALHLYDDGVPTFSQETTLKEYSISPNPVHDQFVAYDNEEPSFDITIFDLAGKPVSAHKGVQQGLAIDVSFLPPGMYLAVFSSNGLQEGIARIVKSN